MGTGSITRNLTWWTLNVAKEGLKNSSVPRFEVPESRFADYLEQSIPVYRKPSRPFAKSASPIAVPSPDTPANLPVPLPLM
jgi:hypothetical protein